MKIKKFLAYFMAMAAISTTASAATAQKDNPKKAPPPVLIKQETAEQPLRSCPSYGPGYFYIPGTNTCFKISGYVRSELSAGDNVSATSPDDFDHQDAEGVSWFTRGSFTLQSASDTKLGVLRSYMQFRDDWKVGGYNKLPKLGNVAELHFAYVELGGLRFGLDESIFAHWTGYYGGVLTDDFITPTSTQRTNVLSYVYSMDNGLSAILGAEQGTPTSPEIGLSYEIKDKEIITTLHELSGYTQSYLPNIVAGVKYMQGWGGVSTVAAYDSYFKSIAAKARLDVNINDFKVWGMVGIKNNKEYFLPLAGNETSIIRIAPSIYGDWFGAWAAWLGGTYKFTPDFNSNVQLSTDANKDFAAALSFNYLITPDFIASPEIAYLKHGDYKISGLDNKNFKYGMAGKNGIKLTFRFTRSF